MTYTAEIFSSSIIAVGDFNPAIFSPDWLEINNLVGKDDADIARGEGIGRPMLVSHQVSTFETEWFALQVLENQFSLSSKGVLSPALQDLAVSIFQLVPHTPITSVGLNFMGHFKIASESEYHRIGDILAPKKIWDTLYQDSSTGLADLTIRIQQGRRGVSLEEKTVKNISLQPSKKIKCGVFMSYNDHHEMSAAENGLRLAEQVSNLVENRWQLSWRDAERVFNSVLSLALGELE